MGRPILFASRTLTNAERTYGPIELELAGLVWSIRRTYTIMQSSEQPIRVLTDHSAIKQILAKSTMDTASTDRANRRLITASIYLSQYDLEVYHVPGKKNFVPNALSRLKAPESDPSIQRRHPQYVALEDVCVATEAVMSDETVSQFLEGYAKDRHWSKIIAMIKDSEDTAKASAGPDRTTRHRINRRRGVPFFQAANGLLYNEAIDGSVRLCVP